MKILAAFDSFKESMSAYQAGISCRKGTNHEVVIVPLADGGEGTMEAMNASLNGVIHQVKVCGPLFKEVEAKYALCDDMAIIESAVANGLDLLKEEEKDALHTTTKGVGEIIIDAYNHGARRFIITLGGSSTNDGGIGMLSSLGIKFLDKNKLEVPLNASGLSLIDTIDTSSYFFKDKDVEIVAACDVENPLTGVNGASYIFGPQKGLKNVEEIDQAMKHYAIKCEEVLGKSFKDIKGTGAAGGLGFAIVSFMEGRLERGFDIVARSVKLEEKIKECDLVFTGEGKIDSQTLSGKTPYGVLRLAQKYNKPVVAFAGKVEDEELLKSAGFKDVRCIVHEVKPLSVLLEEGRDNLEKEVRRYFNESK